MLAKLRGGMNARAIGHALTGIGLLLLLAAIVLIAEKIQSM